MTPPVLDLAFAALSDPTRRAIVQRLAQGAARVTDLAQPFAMSLNAVSKHVKVLERAGLVRRTRAGREHHIALDPEPIRIEGDMRSEEHTSELQSPCNLVCRLLLEKKKTKAAAATFHPLASRVQCEQP